MVVGPKPVKSPSLAGYPNADAEVQSLAWELWGDLDGVMRNRHYYKKGQVVWGLPLKDVLASLPLAKEFECSKPLDVEIPWIHHQWPGCDSPNYFVSIPKRHRERQCAGTFRLLAFYSCTALSDRLSRGRNRPTVH